MEDLVIDDDIDPSYVPTQDEVEQYALWIGMDPEKDKKLLWIAQEGIKAPLPTGWKEIRTKDTDEVYYYNFDDGTSSWDHPCDDQYRSLYNKHKSGSGDKSDGFQTPVKDFGNNDSLDMSQDPLEQSSVLSFANETPIAKPKPKPKDDKKAKKAEKKAKKAEKRAKKEKKQKTASNEDVSTISPFGEGGEIPGISPIGKKPMRAEDEEPDDEADAIAEAYNKKQAKIKKSSRRAKGLAAALSLAGEIGTPVKDETGAVDKENKENDAVPASLSKNQEAFFKHHGTPIREQVPAEIESADLSPKAGIASKLPTVPRSSSKKTLSEGGNVVSPIPIKPSKRNVDLTKSPAYRTSPARMRDRSNTNAAVHTASSTPSKGTRTPGKPPSSASAPASVGSSRSVNRSHTRTVRVRAPVEEFASAASAARAAIDACDGESSSKVEKSSHKFDAKHSSSPKRTSELNGDLGTALGVADSKSDSAVEELQKKVKELQEANGELEDQVEGLGDIHEKAQEEWQRERGAWEAKQAKRDEDAQMEAQVVQTVRGQLEQVQALASTRESTVKRLQESLETTKTDLESSKKTVTAQKMELEQKQQQLGEKQIKFEKQCRQLVTSERELTALRKQLEEAKEQTKEQKQEPAASEAERRRQLMLAATEARLSGGNPTVKAECGAAKESADPAELTLLRQELREEKGKVAAGVEVEHELTATIDSLEAKVATVTQLKDESNREVRKLKIQVADLEQAKASTDTAEPAKVDSAELDQAKAANATLKTDLEQAKASNTTLQADLQQAQASNIVLKNDLEQGKASNATLMTDIEQTKATNGASSVVLDQTKANNAALTTDLEKMKASHATVTAEATKVRLELATTAGALEATTAALEKERQEREALSATAMAMAMTQNIQGLGSTQSKSERELALVGQLRESSEQLQKLRSCYEEISTERDSLEERARQLSLASSAQSLGEKFESKSKAEANSASIQLADLKRQLSEKKQKLEEVVGELGCYREECKQLKENQGSAADRQQQMEAELKQQIERADEGQNTLQEAESEKQMLRQKLHEVRKEREAAVVSDEIGHDQHEKQRQEIEHLKSENSKMAERLMHSLAKMQEVDVKFSQATHEREVADAKAKSAGFEMDLLSQVGAPFYLFVLTTHLNAAL
jgi:centrosomal protein CEP164